MFILKCACGNEVYCSNEESREAWQCDACGAWLDMFGCRVAAPVHDPELEGITCMSFDGL